VGISPRNHSRIQQLKTKFFQIVRVKPRMFGGTDDKVKECSQLSLTNGEYQDVSSTSRAERRERRSRFHQFSAYVYSLFAAGSLFAYIVIERGRDYLYLMGLFAFIAAFSFWMSKRSGRGRTRL
jgi:hypothetical protein